MNNTPAIEENFLHWLARVQAIVGHAVDPKRAMDAYCCDMYPKQNLTAEEYANEIMGIICHDF